MPTGPRLVQACTGRDLIPDAKRPTTDDRSFSRLVISRDKGYCTGNSPSVAHANFAKRRRNRKSATDAGACSAHAPCTTVGQRADHGITFGIFSTITEGRLLEKHGETTRPNNRPEPRDTTRRTVRGIPTQSRFRKSAGHSAPASELSGKEIQAG